MPTDETTLTRHRIGARQRVRVPKTAELVAADLRRRIVRGELKEGDTLPTEAILMERFGVSRPTLREAFRVLEAESLLTVRRGARGGARVHVPSEESAARYVAMVLEHRGTGAADVRLARDAVETSCVATLAGRDGPNVAEELNAALRATETAVADPDRFRPAVKDFHQTLVTATGSTTLFLLWEMLGHILNTNLAEDSPSPSGSDDEVAARRVVHAHQTVVDLIRHGDGERARRHWDNHLRGGDGRSGLPADALGILG
jgi:DNA-binding FadR family transcriptional regulator